MNETQLVGRLVKEPELRYTEANTAIMRNTIAVSGRKGRTDFISFVAWGKVAETICNYIKKGNRFGIVGRIQTGSYDRSDGSKNYTTDVIVEKITFLEYKDKDGENNNDVLPEDDNPFDSDFNTLTDDDLPF